MSHRLLSIMPALGAQHASWAKPFEEAKTRVSEWTAMEIATIASKLDKQLGPEYISSRSGPGGSRVHYLSAEKCIGLANEVFGFNGWSSSIQKIQVDFADENPQTQQVSIGLSVIVRITLRDGTYHEDIGYGSIENARGKAMAFEKAKKEGTTDGLKRALRNFGNVLGNCIYDQDFVKQVTKVKAQPVKKFDQHSLYRHADFVKEALSSETMVSATTAAPKAEPMESFEDFFGELDEADFCVPGEGHPDEMVLPSLPAPIRQASNDAAGEGAGRRQKTPMTATATRTNDSQDGSQPCIQAPPGPGPQADGNESELVAFFSARSVSAHAGPGATVPVGNGHEGPKQLFNPKAESPSIRKTPGIDHSSSKPVSRSGQHMPPAGSQAGSGGQGTGFTPSRQAVVHGARGNVVNPSLDQTRRIGAPSGPGSPLANRGMYKPPSMKRPPAGEVPGMQAARSPLVDMAANVGGTTSRADSGVDTKRQKMM